MGLAEEFNSNFRIMLIVLLTTSVVFFITDNVSFSTINSTENLTNGKLVNLTSFGSTKKIVEYNLSDIQISYDFNPNLYSSLKWLSDLSQKNNNSLVVFDWWPEGHYINAFTHFKALLYSPSSDYMFFTKNPRWNTLTMGSFSDRTVLRDVDTALLSDNPKQLINTMKKYNASILYVTNNDLQSESEMYSYIKSEYIMKLNMSFVENTNPYKVLSGNFPDLNLIYKDKFSAIYSTKPLNELLENDKNSEQNVSNVKIAKNASTNSSTGEKNNSYPGIVI